MNKMKKNIIVPIFIFIVANLLLVIAFAHGGSTDFRGGHYDRSTGEYHYHHGYSAHDHYDMDGDGIVDCPYNFDDKTDHSNNGDAEGNKTDKFYESANGSSSSENVDTQKELSFWDVVVMILEIIGFSILISSQSAFLCWMIVGIIKIIIEAIFKIDIKDSTARRVNIVVVIIAIVASITITISVVLSKNNIL